MAFEISNVDSLSIILEDLCLFKPETPEIKPMDPDTVDEIYII